MAFDNVTFFELHFDGAKFGPQFGSEDEAEAMDEMEMNDVEMEEMAETDMDVEMDEMEMDAESGESGRIVPFLGVFAIAAVAAVVLRRRRGRETDEVEIEERDADAESVEFESAPDQ